MANIELTEDEKMISFYPRTDELKDLFNFHPTETPRGLQFYDKFVLNARQQNELNIFKADIARENHKYMEKHPEIRAMIVLFLRNLLGKSLLKANVRQEAAKFFSRSRSDIEKEIEAYLNNRETKVTKDYDKHDYESSMSVEVPSTVPSRLYTYSTLTDDYISGTSEITISSEEEKGWIVSGLLDQLIVQATAEEHEEEESRSFYIPPIDDTISHLSGITKTSSFIEHTIPSVPDVTTISTDLSRKASTTEGDTSKQIESKMQKAELQELMDFFGEYEDIEDEEYLDRLQKSEESLERPKSSKISWREPLNVADFEAVVVAENITSKESVKKDASEFDTVVVAQNLKDEDNIQRPDSSTSSRREPINVADFEAVVVAENIQSDDYLVPLSSHSSKRVHINATTTASEFEAVVVAEIKNESDLKIPPSPSSGRKTPIDISEVGTVVVVQNIEDEDSALKLPSRSSSGRKTPRDFGKVVVVETEM